MTLSLSGPAGHTDTRGPWKFGFWAAVGTTVLTVVSFAFALVALPNTVPYPFTADVIADQWPWDYVWMYPAMILMLLFVALLTAAHGYAPRARRACSRFALCVGTIAAAVLVIDYYIQVTVMQPSLVKGQFDGWALFTQYNPNGVFIALEELGYLLMSLALVLAGKAFPRKNGLERSIRWVTGISFGLAVIGLIAMAALRGIDRGDDYEILVISIVWLTLIIVGPLMALVFKRARADATFYLATM